ncbi:MAG: SusC/RagA family TonB-linked outer membrane protein, partial [Bacteroidales bacterium]
MKQILLSLALLLTFAQLSWAQTKSVSGTVTDKERGEPVVGATVVISGTTIGSITDIDGKYSIMNLPKSAKALKISYVGMETLTVPISDSKMDVQMASDAELIDEVVVTAMGMTKNARALGYSADAVSGSDIANLEAVNPMTALQGKVAGLQVSSAPGPGATQNVMIRGASSFGNSQPLYVVDGIPIVNEQTRTESSLNVTGNSLNNQVDFGSGINALNPDNIKEMTVLKGAAATALYGSRAANGVILITTKTGGNTNGKMNISYDGSVGFSRVGRIPQRQSQFGQGWSGDRALSENGNWGAPYDGKDRVWGNVVDNSQQVKPYVFLENRVRDFYDLGLNYKNAVSASGGNENTQYLLSFSQTRQDGVMPTDADSYNRYTITVNGSHKANKITVSSQVNFSYEKTNFVPSGQGSSVNRGIWEVPEDVSLVDLSDYNDKFNNLDNYFTPYGLNPYYLLDANGAEQIKTKVFGKVEVAYDITKDLKFLYRFSGDVENSSYDTWIAKVEFSEGSYNTKSSAKTPGSYNQRKLMRYEVNHDLQLMYNKDLNNDFNLSALVGANFNDRGSSWLEGYINSIDVDNFYNLANSTGNPLAKQELAHRRLSGVFGSVDLDFRNYLYFSLTARNDWSSTLPLENNSFFYPGITGSFLFSDFFKEKGVDLGPISFGKVRLSYGWTGNDADMYKIYPVYVASSINLPGYPDVDDITFPLGGVNSYEISNILGSPDLKPEITKEFEGGFDIRFFNNRFGIDFSAYSRITEGLISTQPLDPSSGYTSQVTNLCDLRNVGIELGVNITPIRNKNFQWDMRYTFSRNKSKVMNLPETEVSIAGFGGATIVAVDGEEIGLFKVSVPKTVTIDGVEKVIVDGKGQVVPSADAQVTDRSVNEDWQMGLVNTFKYKNWTFSATLDMHYGGYMFSNTKDYLHWTGAAAESVMNDREPFIVPNSVIEIDNGDGTFSYKENNIPVIYANAHTFYGDYGAFESDLYNVID